MHIRSARSDWWVEYDLPEKGEELTFESLLSRIPDLSSAYSCGSTKVDCASVNMMTYSDREGFMARVSTDQLAGFEDAYSGVGYEVKNDGAWSEIRAEQEIFTGNIPQFVHTYLNKGFGVIPSLYIAKPFVCGSRYSQLAITYVLSYFLGMLTRYFPTHWVALLNGSRGDGMWPVINTAQHYVDTSFPEMVIELIYDRLDKAGK